MFKRIFVFFLFSLFNFKEDITEFKKFFCISIFSQNQSKIIKNLTQYINENKIDFLKNKHIPHKYNYLVLENCLTKIKNIDQNEIFIKIENLISQNNLLDKDYYLKPEKIDLTNLLIPVSEKEKNSIFLISEKKMNYVK